MNSRIVLFCISVVIVWVFPLVAADDSAKETGEPTMTVESNLPVGRLGAGLGEYITIEGILHESRIRNAHSHMAVDTVNGKKLNKPVVIKIENAKLPMGLRYTLKGYENGQMIGEPPALLKAAKETGGDISKLGGGQAGWQWSAHFVVLVSVYPENLEIKSPQGR